MRVPAVASDRAADGCRGAQWAAHAGPHDEQWVLSQLALCGSLRSGTAAISCFCMRSSYMLLHIRQDAHSPVRLSETVAW